MPAQPITLADLLSRYVVDLAAVFAQYDQATADKMADDFAAELKQASDDMRRAKRGGRA